MKTVRDRNETFADCRRKNYGYVRTGHWTVEYFGQRERRFHDHWDEMAASHGLQRVNVPFERLADKRYVLQLLLELRRAFFPEITMESAHRSVNMFPHRSAQV